MSIKRPEIEALKSSALHLGALAFGDFEEAEKHRKAAEEFAEGARRAAEAAKRLAGDTPE